MQTYDFASLALPFATVFLFVFLLSFRYTGDVISSLLLGGVKSGFFVIYFALFFNGFFTFLDDWSYFNGGLRLLDDLSTGFSASIFSYLLNLAEGQHFLYYLHNAIAAYFWPGGYFAPVALNILLATLVAVFGSEIYRLAFSKSGRVSVLFYVYLSLWPAIFAWSQMINVKDIAVLLLHVMILYFFIMTDKGRIYWLFVLILFFILFYFRFYATFIFAISFFVYYFVFNWKVSTRLIFSFFFLWPTLYLASLPIVKHSASTFLDNFSNPIFGLFRFISSPRPFFADGSYVFLNIPSLIYWGLIPFAGLGFIIVAKMKTQLGRFLIIYFCLFLVLYSSYVELQGPRHRLQLEFVICLFSYLGLRSLFVFQKSSIDGSGNFCFKV